MGAAQGLPTATWLPVAPRGTHLLTLTHSTPSGNSGCGLLGFPRQPIPARPHPTRTQLLGTRLLSSPQGSEI